MRYIAQGLSAVKVLTWAGIEIYIVNNQWIEAYSLIKKLQVVD